jgi:hypothetical protein
MKEEMLRSYLMDDVFIEKGYLKPGEAESFKWTDRRKNKLIDALKLAIEGVTSGEGERVTERKINLILSTGA